jgi:hypothetical protein
MRFIQRTSFVLRRFISSNTCSGTSCSCNKGQSPKKIYIVDDRNMATDKNINFAIMDTLVYQTEEIKHMKLELMRLNEKINTIMNIPCIKKG